MVVLEEKSIHSVRNSHPSTATCGGSSSNNLSHDLQGATCRSTNNAAYATQFVANILVQQRSHSNTNGPLHRKKRIEIFGAHEHSEDVTSQFDQLWTGDLSVGANLDQNGSIHVGSVWLIPSDKVTSTTSWNPLKHGRSWASCDAFVVISSRGCSCRARTRTSLTWAPVSRTLPDRAHVALCTLGDPAHIAPVTGRRRIRFAAVWPFFMEILLKKVSETEQDQQDQCCKAMLPLTRFLGEVLKRRSSDQVGRHSKPCRSSWVVALESSERHPGSETSSTCMVSSTIFAIIHGQCVCPRS